MELQAACEHFGKTQAQVATEANVSERIYQEYEYDESELCVRTAVRIAKVLDSTAAALFGARAPAMEETPGGNRANQ